MNSPTLDRVDAVDGLQPEVTSDDVVTDAAENRAEPTAADLLAVRVAEVYGDYAYTGPASAPGERTPPEPLWNFQRVVTVGVVGLAGALFAFVACFSPVPQVQLIAALLAAGMAILIRRLARIERRLDRHVAEVGE